jgi:hypothetical protein
MAPKDFDDLSRSVATAKSRRRMLGLVLGSAAGGVAALAGFGHAGAQGGGCGGRRGPCPEGQVCVAGSCVCPPPPGGDCESPGVVCGGTCVTCSSGQLLDPSTCTCVSCPPAGCTGTGETVCGDVCCEPGDVCQAEGFCCTPATPDDCPAFIECGPMHDPCSGTDVDCGDCPAGQLCQGGTCVDDGCASCDLGAPCTAPGGGAGILQCVGGVCVCTPT